MTVIDAFNILADFSTADLLSHRRDDVTPEDERTISELMVDQIEFANVVVLNKTDLVSEEQRGRIRSLIRSLNHDCAVLETHHGRVDVHAIVNTGLFDLDKARVGYGWLQDLNQLMLREVNGKNTVTPKPETEEYGVRNFAYVRHRPFHPRRLWKLVYQTFVLQLDVPEDGEEDEEDEEEAEDEEDDDDDDGAENVAMVDPDDKAQAEDDEWEDEEDSGRGEDAHGSSDGESAGAASDLSSPPSSRQDSDLKPPADDGVILANKKAHPLFAGLFRSKGEFFLATRPHRAGEWSQAGAMLKLVGGREWFCVLPEAAYLTGNAEIDACTRHDIAKGGEWGDRRQELVFIGEKLDMAALERELDACLLTEAEFAAWAKIMRRKGLRGPEKLEKLLEKLQDVFDDGFPDWPGHEEWVDVDDDGHGHAHSQKTTGDAV